MGPFLLSYYVGVYLFLINLTGEHSDYKLVHVSVFVWFFKAFQHFDSAYEYLACNYISSKLYVYFFKVNFLSVDLKILFQGRLHL